MKKFRRHAIHLLLAVSILIGGLSIPQTAASAAGTDEMKVHFINVGQGDSTLITCGGHSMLIDAGDDTQGTAIQNYLQKQKVEKLDYLILTHPDADHIGGAPVIITKFDIGKVFMSNFEKDNNTYRKLIQALDDKRYSYTTPKVGSKYTLGTASITILAPNDTYDNPNDASIALLVKNGNNTFLFTGDAEKAAESDILNNGIDISADVYKAGHHGSRSSTSLDFFRAVDPDYAVISCGEGNSYGHPHAETLNTFRMNGVKTYRIDEDGTIVATSDGKSITFNVPASESWKAGEPTGSSQTAARSSAASGTAQSKQNGSPSTSAQPKQTESASASTQPQNGSGAATATPQQNESAPAVETAPQPAGNGTTTELTYVLNVKTKKFHKPTCNSLPTTNRLDSSESRESIIAQGYDPCKKCNP